MHMRGTPQTMQTLTSYEKDIATEVCEYFAAKCQALRDRGVNKIILDPGFGFAKTLEQNYELLAGLHRLCAMGYPVLAGLSRKSMIYRVLDSTPEESLAGTTALHWEALRQGASILRVHDIREASDIIKLFRKYTSLL
jgi:dihydropteroate synthase